MAQVTLSLITAALVLVALFSKSSAGVIDEDDSHKVRKGCFNLDDGFDLPVSSDEQGRSSTDKPQDVTPEGASQVHAGISVVEDAEESADEDPAEDVENEVLPAIPANEDQDQVKKVELGQPRESRYRHGVAPAKLPALETDKAHAYRTSIIHPYGDDLHA